MTTLFAAVFLLLGACCAGAWIVTVQERLLQTLSNIFAIAALAFVVLATMAAIRAASAQDGIRGHGHAEHHDQYRHLSNPQTGMHCCNAQTADGQGDCRPGAVWRDIDGQIKARIGGRIVRVPESALLPPEMNPHAPVGLICEKNDMFYCAALSGAGG